MKQVGLRAYVIKLLALFLCEGPDVTARTTTEVPVDRGTRDRLDAASLRAVTFGAGARFRSAERERHMPESMATRSTHKPSKGEFLQESDDGRACNRIPPSWLEPARIKIADRLNDWRELLRRHVPQARQIISKLLNDRLSVTSETRDGVKGFRLTADRT